MTKPFDIRPRWRNLLLLRVSLFAISIVLSSSGENVEPTFDTTDRILSAPRRRLGQASSVGSAIDPLLDHDFRALHSKSTTSKSSKSGSKSGSKGSKSKSAKSGSKSGSKGSKSKSAKSKSGSKSGSKGSKSKSATGGSKSGSKGSKSKSAKSGSKSDSEGKSKTGKSESAVGKSAKSPSSAKSTSDDALIQLPNDSPEDETSIAVQSTLAEMKSVHYDSMYIEGDHVNESVSSSVSSHTSSTDDTKATGTARPDATPSSLDGAENKGMVATRSSENETLTKTENLEDDFMDERIEESNSDINYDGDHDAHSADGGSQTEIGEISSSSSEGDNASVEGIIEERIDHCQTYEHLFKKPTLTPKETISNMSSVSQGIAPSTEIISQSLEPETRHSKLKRDRQFDSEPFDEHVSKKPKRGRVHNKTGAWINQEVMVTHGKYRGEIGHVKESGHGFYCVALPGRGDIMKRGAQLQRVSDIKRPVHRASKAIAMDLASNTETDPKAEQAKLRKAAFILVDLMRDRQTNPFAERFRHRPSSLLSTNTSLRINLDHSSKRDLSSSGSDSESNQTSQLLLNDLRNEEMVSTIYSSGRLSTSTSDLD